MLKAKEYIVEKFICQMKTNAVDLGKITKALIVNLIKLSNFNSTLGSTYLEAKKASLVWMKMRTFFKWMTLNVLILKFISKTIP